MTGTTHHMERAAKIEGELVAEGTDIQPVASRLQIDRRTIQIALGVLWIIAAGLKFQPRMFGTSFITMVIDPMAAGQPGVRRCVDHPHR